MKTFKQYLPFLFAAVITLLLFNSCVITEKQKQRFLAKNCERKDSLVRITEDRLVYKDTILYISEPGETIYLENPCKLLCDSLGNLKKVNVTTNKGGVKGNVKTVGNSLVFTAYTDSLIKIIKWHETHRTVKDFSHTESKIERVCERKHRTGLDNAARWFSLFTIVAIAAAVIIRRFV